MPDPTGGLEACVMTPDDLPAQSCFRIWVDGRLAEHFAESLDGIEQRDDQSGTVLSGDYLDDAHLSGVLDQLRRMGIRVHRFEIAEKQSEEKP